MRPVISQLPAAHSRSDRAVAITCRGAPLFPDAETAGEIAGKAGEVERMKSLFREYDLLANSGYFDSKFYLEGNPEVVGMDPILHYLEKGGRQGRNPHPKFDTDFYLEQCARFGERPENPLLHFLTIGIARGLRPSREAPLVTKKQIETARVLAPTAPARATVPPVAAPRPSRPGASSAPVLPSRPGPVVREIAAAAPPTIIATLDELTAVALADGKCAVRGNGWAVSPTGIKQVGVEIEGVLMGLATYGLSRPDVAKQFPRYPRADSAGLSFDIPLAYGGQPDILVAIAITTAAGESKEIRQRIAVKPREVPANDISPKPAGNNAPAAVSPVQLQIDLIAVDESGLLTVEGWAASLTGGTQVEIFSGSEKLGDARIGRARDDVGQTYPKYLDAKTSGFEFLTFLDGAQPAPQQMRIVATAKGGCQRELIVPLKAAAGTLQQSAETDLSVKFQCDELSLTANGELSVQGWVFGPHPLKSVSLSLDGSIAGEAKIGLSRPDVGNTYPRHRTARTSGFAFKAAMAGTWEDEHLVSLHATDIHGSVAEFPLPLRVTPVPQVQPQQSGHTSDKYKFYLDSPVLDAGKAVNILRSNLHINGWATARGGVKSIDIEIDGVPTGSAYYGVRREDVAASYPDWENALLSGFGADIPFKHLLPGTHHVRLVLCDTISKIATIEFQVEVEAASDLTGPYMLRQKMSQVEADFAEGIFNSCEWHPEFTLTLPVHSGSDRDAIHQTIASITSQAYKKWTLDIVHCDGKAGDAVLAKELERYASRHGRQIRIRPQADCKTAIDPGIFDRERRTIGFFSVVAPGVRLSCDALLEIAVASATHQEADFLYCDERRISPVTGRLSVYLKPGWSPDLLLSTNYIGAFWCARWDVAARMAMKWNKLPQASCYDLVLRLTEDAARIHHLPEVLFEAPETQGEEEAKAALGAAMKRRDIKGEVLAACAPGIYRLRRSNAVSGMVSVIIPTCAAKGLIKTCIETFRKKTRYRNFELVCIENIAEADAKWKRWLRKHADKVIETSEPFNWSRFNNLAAEQASGEFLLFLNDDIEIIEEDWLDAMLEHAMREDVGAVGPQLLYPDRRVQHAGLFLTHTGTARHAFRFHAEDDPGYFGAALSQRNVIAVTGACLLTRRDVFDSVGRFDEQHAVVNNDLAFCLKLHRQGLLTVYTPYAKLIHHELASRSQITDAYDSKAFDSEWKALFLEGDPYFNPNLSFDFDDFVPEQEPVRRVFTGYPLFSKAGIRTILVVKLDHLGDCITALPAIRHLQQRIPNARICVLAAKSTAPIWATEPCIAEHIVFDFFHTKSSLGPREMAEEDLAELQRRLAPYQFDLAIDLRKTTDTRDILKYTGAGRVAGFDSQNKFPWLDVAIPWEEDPRFLAKRQHIASDLLNLVDAVANATNMDRMVIIPRDLPPLTPGLLPENFFQKRVICLHPASGNEMRQWPRAHFASLIDLLAVEEDANLIIVGSPGEEDITSSILSLVKSRDKVFSVVGKLKLSELPSLLMASSLFVGNNSGPHHLAAALGVPTLGIHSGVVDAIEWGPLGPNAAAIRRAMSCSPCYLEKPEYCTRGLACLKTLRPADVFAMCRRLLATGYRRAGRAEKTH